MRIACIQCDYKCLYSLNILVVHEYYTKSIVKTYFTSTVEPGYNSHPWDSIPDCYTLGDLLMQ